MFDQYQSDLRGGGSGPIVPGLRFNAMSGKFTAHPRRQNEATGEYETVEIDLTDPVDVVIDISRAGLGWRLTAPGVYDPRFVKLIDLHNGTPPIAQPSADHKQAVRLPILGHPTSPIPGLWNFDHDAQTIRIWANGIAGEWKAETGSDWDKALRARIEGFEKLQFKGGRSACVPRITAKSWIDRPDALVDAEVEDPPFEAAAPATNAAPAAPAEQSAPAVPPADNAFGVQF